MKRALPLLASLCICAVDAQAQSQPDTSTTVSFGAFVDAYYAFDFNEPAKFDRSFTTQPARHNEFNANLAFIEAKLAGPRIRGRFALQAGTSVQSNYSGEPQTGSVSGPSLGQHIQEAVAGFQLAPGLWVDGGIFFSHIGMESFISRDNLTYTRSLSADYTPYYETGVKLTWTPAPRLTALVAVLNGWQNISENNKYKAGGARIDYAANARTTLSYYNFLGKENSSGNLRFFNGVGVKATVGRAVTLQANGDYGTQDNDAGGNSTWYSAGLTMKVQPNPRFGVSGRVETYHDPDQVIIVTGTTKGFVGMTSSIGLDVSPLGSNRMLWRTEGRGTWLGNAVFPRRSGDTLTDSDFLLVSSLAVSF